MTKTDSMYPAFWAFSLRFFDSAVSFLPGCKFSFHEKWDSSQAWEWRDVPESITILCQRITTNKIASFCIDHRWRQMAFFVFVKMRKAPLLRALCEIKHLLCVQSSISCYIKQIDSMLPCICPVIDHRERQNVLRTSVTHSAIREFFSNPMIYLFLIFPCMTLYCKLVPVHYQEYEYGLFLFNWIVWVTPTCKSNIAISVEVWTHLRSGTYYTWRYCFCLCLCNFCYLSFETYTCTLTACTVQMYTCTFMARL